jgi:hypothetical protein
MHRILLAAAFAAAALAAAGVATAGREQQTLLCDGVPLTLTVTTTTNDNSVAWGVGTISGGTHLIPTSFGFTAVDLTAGGVTLFSGTQTKGNGHALPGQPLVTCTSSEQSTAGALGIPGVPPADVIELDLTVTAVLRG